MPLLLAVVGMCGSGKSEATKVLLDNHGFSPVHFGAGVLEEVKRRGLAINQVNERAVREELRRQNGMDAVARLSIRTIQQLLTAGRPTVIDGLYSLAEYEYLRSIFKSGFVVLAVHAARRIRYKRMAERSSRPLTSTAVDERDMAELKNLDKGGPIAIADCHCINEGSRDDLRRHIRRLVQDCLQ